MNPLVLVCSLVCLIVMIAVFLPFVWGPGGLLQDAAASDNIETLMKREQAILQRWLRDESAAAAGEISKTEWQQRQSYLTSRYVDLARRIAWLKSSDTQQEKA